ncbi:Alpha-1,3-mannosyltransferase CMT1 [Galdieria sulphuraria]|nr:Alpha-1,3-mannosyltransferase CMT1 [Galdieria sulphuraria]
MLLEEEDSEASVSRNKWKKVTQNATLCLADNRRIVAIVVFVIIPICSFTLLLLPQERKLVLDFPRGFNKGSILYSAWNNSFLLRNSSDICNNDEYVPSVSSLLRGASVLLALNIRNGGHVLPHIAVEVLKLSKYFLPDSLFVSIYESGSKDTSGLCLHKLAEELNMRNIRHRIIVNGSIVRESKENRIHFLSRIRNEVLEPLYTGNFSAKYVAFINDVFFCANQITRLLLHIIHGADMVCGLDYGSDLKFYDIWVTRDIHGGPVTNAENCSIFQSKSDVMLCQQRKLVPVFSCWNGLVAMNADIFSKSNIRFRSVDNIRGDCPASECTLLCLDLWRNNHQLVYVDPEVKVAYDSTVFSKIFSQSGTILNRSIIEVIREEELNKFLPPQYYFCEPLPPYSTRDDPNRARASWYPV